MIVQKLPEVTSSTKTIAVLSCALIISIAGYNWLIEPQTRCLKAADQYSMLSTTVNGKAMDLKKEISEITPKLEAITVQCAKQKERFFSADKAEDFFRSLEEAASDKRCSVRSVLYDEPLVRISAEQNQSAVEILSKKAIVRFQAEYQHIVDLLNYLGGFDEYIQVNTLSISLDEPDSSKLNCDLEITVYILNEL